MANQIHAMIRFTAATAAILDRSGAVTGIVRNAAGDYTLTLSQGIDASERDVRVTQLHNAVRGGVSVEETSDTVLRVRCADAAGALADPTEVRIAVYRTQRIAF